MNTVVACEKFHEYPHLVLLGELEESDGCNLLCADSPPFSRSTVGVIQMLTLDDHIV